MEKNKTMTREEEIKQAADGFGLWSAGEAMFKLGAEWADEHPKDNLVNIDYACEVIKHLLGGYIIRNFHFGDSYDMDKFIDDFKKELKGE